jgi:hypothetical protein
MPSDEPVRDPLRKNVLTIIRLWGRLTGRSPYPSARRGPSMRARAPFPYHGFVVSFSLRQRFEDSSRAFGIRHVPETSYFPQRNHCGAEITPTRACAAIQMWYLLGRVNERAARLGAEGGRERDCGRRTSNSRLRTVASNDVHHSRRPGRQDNSGVVFINQSIRKM